MTSSSSTPYPAEYYYPEFIESRTDEPRVLPPPLPSLSSLIDNGVRPTGATSSIEQISERTKARKLKRKLSKKQQPSSSLAHDVVTNQGLPDVDITAKAKTDPKTSLVRDPTERNIPKLTVDDSVIKQAVERPPKIVPTTNLDDILEQKNSTPTKKFTTIERKPTANGYAMKTNGDLTEKNKLRTTKTTVPIRQQRVVKVKAHEEPIDDYWKKELIVGDDGLVSIEPLKYDKHTYDGPFGLTRTGSYIFYIGMSLFTLLAAIFLIMTGLFYGRSYPDSSSNTAKLAGVGICALAFYIGIELILIGIWHQKRKEENLSTIQRQIVTREPPIHAVSNREIEPYGYPPPQEPQPQQYDYTSYGNYPVPYSSTLTNEQMLLQQPGGAVGTAYYDPVVWPSNVEVEAQPDARFFQPMEWPYAEQQQLPVSAAMAPAPPPLSLASTPAKVEKKHHRRHTETIKAEPPNTKFDNLFPNSTVVETPLSVLPVLPKAPETTELIKNAAKMEQSYQQFLSHDRASIKTTNRIQPLDGTDNSTDLFSLHSRHPNHRHSHRRHSHRHRSRNANRHHHHHHHHRHHRPHSYSPCSTCSDRSSYHGHSDFHSDISHHRPYYPHSYKQPSPKIIIPRPPKPRTPTPPRAPLSNTLVYRDTGTGTGLETKIMRDSSVGVDLEDVPNIADDRLEQLPIIRRTIIVEPYPAQPSSQIIVKPRTDMIGKVRLSKNVNKNQSSPILDRSENNETIIWPRSTLVSRKDSKKKKKKRSSISRPENDLHLEDIDDNADRNERSIGKKKKKKTTTKGNSELTSAVKNAFYG